MFYRTLLSRHRFNKLNAFLLSHFPKSSSTLLSFPHTTLYSPSPSSTFHSFPKHFHSTRVTQLSANSLVPVLNSSDLGNDDENAHYATMNEFLSGYMWLMRKRVTESYPDSDEQDIDLMLLVIIEKVVSELEKRGFENILEASSASFESGDFFSEDLWSTAWEVSNEVLEDMNKERKKGFFQCEEVGIRGDLLREMRCEWQRNMMEELEFYDRLERENQEESEEESKEESKEESEEESEVESEEGIQEFEVVGEEKVKEKVVTLPKRKGKIDRTHTDFETQSKEFVGSAVQRPKVWRVYTRRAKGKNGTNNAE